jgi:hypothetical protein
LLSKSLQPVLCPSSALLDCLICDSTNTCNEYHN